MENISENTWVLVYNDSTKEIITIVEPGYTTTTLFTLKEFNTKEELEGYILQNNLMKTELT